MMQGPIILILGWWITHSDQMVYVVCGSVQRSSEVNTGQIVKKTCDQSQFGADSKGKESRSPWLLLFLAEGGGIYAVTLACVCVCVRACTPNGDTHARITLQTGDTQISCRNRG